MLSFRNSLPAINFVPNFNTTFPLTSQSNIAMTPFLASFWSGFSLPTGAGTVSFRHSSNSSLIGQAVGLLSADNAELTSEYEPDLVFVATWNEVAIEDEDDRVRDMAALYA